MKRGDWCMNAIYMHVQNPSTLDISINPWCGGRIASEKEITALQSLFVSDPYNAGISSVFIVLADKRNQQSIWFLQLT